MYFILKLARKFLATLHEPLLENLIKALEEESGRNVMPISAVMKIGLDNLLDQVWKKLES